MRTFNNLIKTLVIFAVFQGGVQAASINWQSWSEAAFNLAKQENKLIFLDVGTEWCSACNQMQHETYTDTGVQHFLSENFVSIHVDAEAEPDLGERYGFWGWPALIFITPQGEHVGFYRGFRPAQDFTAIMEQLTANFRNGTLDVPDIEVDLVSPPSTDEFKQLVDLGNQMIDRFYDTDNGGWGGARMADPFLFQQARWRSQGADQAHWLSRVQDTSKQYLKLIDPIWGGVWFGSRAENFSEGYIHEKRTEHQAGALRIFARAYQHDRQDIWLQAIDKIVDYLDEFMRVENGGYYTSQEMHLYSVGAEIEPEAYFRLDDIRRREIGMPTIDTTQYIDINAKLVIAFAQLYEATGEQQWRERALETMNHLQSAGDRGRYKQIISHGTAAQRARKLPENNESILYLRTQAFAGLAGLACFQISGDASWLRHAHEIGEVILAHLYDAGSGGLYGSTRKARGPNGKPLADQPLIDTGAAAELFNRLSAYSYGAYETLGKYDSKQYHQYAENVLRAVAQPERLRVQGNFIGQYVLALHQWQDEFIQVSVVCPELDHPACRNLHDMSLAEFEHPRRIVKLQTPGYYPERGIASLFICNTTACSSPIAYNDPELMEKTTKWFNALDGSGSAEIPQEVGGSGINK